VGDRKEIANTGGHLGGGKIRDQNQMETAAGPRRKKGLGEAVWSRNEGGAEEGCLLKTRPTYRGRKVKEFVQNLAKCKSKRRSKSSRDVSRGEDAGWGKEKERAEL